MKLRPLGYRLVIKKVKPEEKTKSGIVLPDSAKEAPLIAEVVAIGEAISEDKENKAGLKIGDRVIFSEYAGTEVDLEGDKVTILKLEDILAVVE